MSKASVLPGGMKLVGDVGGDEDLVVFGAVEGEVHIGGALVVEQSGSVRGNVHARTVAIRGTVVGDATAGETIRVDDGGRMVGDVRAPRVNIVKGARFRGHVHMTGRDGQPGRAPAPQARPALPEPENAVQATFAPQGRADLPPPSPRRGPERRDRRARREREVPPRDEVPTAAGSVRAVHERATVAGSEMAPAGGRRKPPAPQMPKLRRTRARRKDHGAPR